MNLRKTFFKKYNYRFISMKISDICYMHTFSIRINIYKSKLIFTLFKHKNNYSINLNLNN